MIFLGSLALAWFQPRGPGILGILATVALLSRRLPARASAVLIGAALAAVALTSATGGGKQPWPVAMVSELGLLAVYAMGLMARRLGGGNIQVERLMTQLEQTRGADVRAAALAERQRLAREMHDVLAHSLSGLSLQLEGARLLAAQSPADPRLADTIERAHHFAKTGLEEARRAIGMLRDDELPGPHGLAALAAEFERDSGVRCQFVVSGDPQDLNPGTRLALYRVAQEALTNIRKHAHPQRVDMCLRYEPNATLLRIQDFGSGTESQHGQARKNGGGGYGLTGMRERAELLGGRLVAAPTHGGFLVELRIPA